MNSKRTYGIILGLLLGMSSVVMAQHNEVLKLTRQGNKEFEKADYKEAEVNYRKALELELTHFTAQYNLANNLYKQERYKEAAEQFSDIMDIAPNDKIKSQILHNLGNSYLKEKEYEKSVAAYKNALKINPNDNDTRYNYLYAKKLLEKQQQQNKDQKKNQNKDQKKDNKEQKKDNKEQDKKEQDQQKQESKDKQEQNKNKEQQKPQPQKISKKDAERMLKAMQQKEKNTKQKLDKKKVKARISKTENDW